MKTYKALIVEDVKDTSEYILGRIKTLCPQIKEIDQAYTLDQAYDTILVGNYDILFLDIQMTTGTSFDLLKRLKDKEHSNFEIIFITGESAKEFTLRAIKYSAIDFLYKPLDDAELVIAVNKAIDKLNKQNHNQQISLLLSRMGVQSMMNSDKIAFHLHSGVVELVDVADLTHIEANGVVSIVHLSNGNKFTTNRNLGFYKEMMVLDYDFFPISNSFLVNPIHIKRYNHRKFTLILENDVVLTTSRRYGKELKELLLNDKKNFGLRKLFSFFKK